MSAVVAAEWSTKRLSDIATVIRGASPRPIASSCWFDDRSDVGWVRIGDLGRSDGRTLTATTQHLSQDGIARSRYLQPGTLILSIAATVGVPIVTGIPACIHDGFVAIQNLKGIDQSYLLYSLKALRDQLQTSGQTGSQSNVNTALVGRLQVPIPPVDEQRAIAEALADTDDLIATLERLIAKKQAIKQGMMQHCMALPADPENRATIGSLTKLLSGGTPDRANAAYWSGTIPWVSAITLKDIEVGTSDQLVTARAVRTGSRMAPLQSTLVLVRGSALHSEIRASLVTAPVCFNQDVKALVPSSEVEPKFLTYSIHANAARLLRLVTSAGNTAGVLDTRVLKGFEIWLPDAETQRRVIGMFNDVNDELRVLSNRLNKVRDVKQGMMQELLTGRTRLPVEGGDV